ncbi:hypothetical protein AB3N02_21700 [Priestia aryabhattai]|uniref:hypothetical protein n=1 Tax=Priestia aryabhattai TaxID=412384 RepID=UPI0039A3B39F
MTENELKILDAIKDLAKVGADCASTVVGKHRWEVVIGLIEDVKVVEKVIAERKELKRYMIVFYNRFANQTQTFKVMAKNEYCAGRLFYKKYNRKAYHDCIEMIVTID